ncbi:hypothetical protein [Alkalicoccobacillus murimartini]|uniref:Uncharacterized protein YebE (UPF0316 family) n=1 Tax=Alkalicoccobacillus murimartini TaxID=171685 RepID=A0ABT9YLP8_9BACI|nr:hypothetical protein [Alkalicoccobacillus murimartini]MDQ0208810.1 uncharacterized protein YebE (UPF0316 family) [Alkalicoccobacillus murimartini]
MAILMLLLFVVFPTILIVLSMFLKRFRYVVFLLAFLFPFTLIVWGSDVESIRANLDGLVLYTVSYSAISAVTMIISAKVRKTN